MLTFRRAELEDALQISDFEDEYFGDEGMRYGTIVAAIHKCRILVAETSERIVGYVVATTWLNKSELDRLVVAKAYRRKGIGRLLFQEAIEMLKANKYEIMMAFLPVTNKTLVGIYKKLQFVKVEIATDFYDDGAAAYKMVIQLPS